MKKHSEGGIKQTGVEEKNKGIRDENKISSLNESKCESAISRVQ